MTGDPSIVVRASDGAAVDVSRFGAHVCRWRSADGIERLYLSPLSRTATAPIRGGIPIVFPQFADQGPLPMHGFARTSTWEVTEDSAQRDGARRLVLTLNDAPATRAMWPHAFRLDVSVTVGGPVLDVELVVTNSGSAAFEFASALHTYLRVSGASAHLLGLREAPFIDGTRDRRVVTSDGTKLPVDREIERYYHRASSPVSLVDGDWTVTVHQDGFPDRIVWNPWSHSPERFPDLPRDGYRHFVCVEAASIERPITLAPGAQWRGRQRLEVAYTMA